LVDAAEKTEQQWMAHVQDRIKWTHHRKPPESEKRDSAGRLAYDTSFNLKEDH
jgi:hypothetical protein